MNGIGWYGMVCLCPAGSSSLSSAAVIMAKTKSLFRQTPRHAPKELEVEDEEEEELGPHHQHSAPYIFARLTLTAAIAEWSYAQSSAKLASLLALHDLLTSRPKAKQKQKQTKPTER